MLIIKILIFSDIESSSRILYSRSRDRVQDILEFPVSVPVSIPGITFSTGDFSSRMKETWKKSYFIH